MHMDKSAVAELLRAQRAFFASGRTRTVSFRIDQLTKLRDAVLRNEQAILDALQRDLGKPAFEAFGGDIAIVTSEIEYALRNIRSWVKPKRTATPLALFPSTSRILSEPYGVSLIIGSWNFPFQLTLGPLAGSISAGNCSVIKCSDVAPASSRLIAQIIRAVFDPGYVSVVEGGSATARLLLKERFDYIFFTGSTETGRQVMAAAAENLTPLTLELGGEESLHR